MGIERHGILLAIKGHGVPCGGGKIGLAMPIFPVVGGNFLENALLTASGMRLA